jgi:hypothetical protein
MTGLDDSGQTSPRLVRVPVQLQGRKLLLLLELNCGKIGLNLKQIFIIWFSMLLW